MSDVPQHSQAFKLRRFLNWFPLGLTYATFYMGRYNFNVVKGNIGAQFHLDKAQLGTVATAGFWTYALSVMFNGPLADRFGGKKAILLGSLGAALFNLIIGLAFFGGWNSNVLLGLTLLYAANSYFQSFGALSVVKVNAPWFHTRERGVFSGLFGIMISSGYLLAFTVGETILEHFSFWAVFAIPALCILTMFVVDLLVVKEKPSDAGHPDFDTGESAEPDDGKPVQVGEVIKRVVGNPVIRTIAVAEFCTGFVRQGLMFYYKDYLKEVHHAVDGSALLKNAGLGVTVGGIVGGLLCGFLSDKVFQSRRPPVAMIFYLLQVPALLSLQYAPSAEVASFMVGFCCTWIFGVHGMLSGAASVDFGGKKAAATAAGLLDGIAYIASGFTGFGLGLVIEKLGWAAWTWSIVPFSLLGAMLMWRLWHVRPAGAEAPAPAPQPSAGGAA